MTSILALDTSTEACSVALRRAGVTMERFEVLPRLHGRKLLPMIEALMAEAQLNYQELDAIAFGRGPGSFTGLRIAASVAQGLAFAADLPVVPVSTLAALAQGALPRFSASAFLTLLDARMNQIYWAAYAREQESLQLLGEEHLSGLDDLGRGLPWEAYSWVGLGEGWQLESKLPAAVGAKMIHLDSACYPHAADIALLAEQAYARGEHLAAEHAQPLYLRDKTAWRNMQQQDELRNRQGD